MMGWRMGCNDLVMGVHSIARGDVRHSKVSIRCLLDWRRSMNG